jgi:hypothetical protein
MIDLGPLPKLHERFNLVQKAKGELGRLLTDWTLAHHLTLIEEAQLLSQAVDDALRYALRKERHGTTEKKADEA